jgi:hypothetical protein
MVSSLVALVNNSISAMEGGEARQDRFFTSLISVFIHGLFLISYVLYQAAVEFEA